MSYEIDSVTEDCYPNTLCLINKFGIQNEESLALVEAGITTLKEAEFLDHPFSGSFDFIYYKAIHRFLFEDIYDWAGQIRTVDIAKKKTKFLRASDIESTAEQIFGRLNRMNNFVGMPFEEFVENIADFYCTTNMLHPFREGNGRTQRLFISQLIRNAGYEISFSEIDPDELMIATIQAAGGVRDSLLQIFRKSIRIHE